MSKLNRRRHRPGAGAGCPSRRQPAGRRVLENGYTMINRGDKNCVETAFERIGAVGAAGSTGRGEANHYGLCSFVVVEQMRRVATPKDAVMEALRRIRDYTVESRLLTSRGLPAFNVNFYIVSKAGDHAGVALYADPEESRYAVCTENGAELAPIEALLEGDASA